MPGRLSLLILALGLSLAPPAVSQAPAPFAVAAVDAAGIVEPVGRFDGAEWARIWDEPKPRAELPASWEQIPAAWFPPDGRAPREWFLWLSDDPRAVSAPFEERSGRRLTVSAPAIVRAGCKERVGLATDYRPSERSARAEASTRAVRIGVALSSDAVRVEQPVVLPPDSPLIQTIVDRAIGPFHRSEEDQLELLEAPARRDVPPFAARRTAPVRWTRAVRLGVAQAPVRTFYLEGESVYGSIVMVGHVWVQIDRQRDTIDAEVMLSDPDRLDARTRAPLGVIRVGERRFWVFDVRARDHYGYEIVEASGSGGRPLTWLDVAAGGC